MDLADGTVVKSSPANAGSQVRSTCCKRAESRSHNNWASTHNSECSPLTATRESLCTATKTQRSQKEIYNTSKIKKKRITSIPCTPSCSMIITVYWNSGPLNLVFYQRQQDYEKAGNRETCYILQRATWPLWCFHIILNQSLKTETFWASKKCLSQKSELSSPKLSTHHKHLCLRKEKVQNPWGYPTALAKFHYDQLNANKSRTSGLHLF